MWLAVYKLDYLQFSQTLWERNYYFCLKDKEATFN